MPVDLIYSIEVLILVLLVPVNTTLFILDCRSKFIQTYFFFNSIKLNYITQLLN